MIHDKNKIPKELLKEVEAMAAAFEKINFDLVARDHDKQGQCRLLIYRQLGTFTPHWHGYRELIPESLTYVADGVFELTKPKATKEK